MPLNTFRIELTKAIKRLPICAMTDFTIVEETEKHTRKLLGIPELFIRSYYQCREPDVFLSHGLFKSQMNG